MIMVVTQCNAENAKHLLSSASNMQSNGSANEILVFCWIQWALTSGAKGL